jgi:hypothetical protein
MVSCGRTSAALVDVVTAYNRTGQAKGQDDHPGSSMMVKLMVKSGMLAAPVNPLLWPIAPHRCRSARQDRRRLGALSTL